MWFCQKCNKWYNDSVTILKHLQSCYPSQDHTKQLKTDAKCGTPASVKMHILKPTIAKFIVKKKSAKSQISNGHSSETDSCHYEIMNKKEKSKEASKSQVNSTSMPPVKKNPNQDAMLVPGRRDSNTGVLFKMVGKDEGLMNKIRTYICKFCCRKFQNSDQLQTHLKTHQGNPKHACHLCGISAGTFSALMAHYVKHSGLKTFSVPHTPCGNKTLLNATVKKKEHTNQNLNGVVCGQCKKHFNTQKSFNIHYCPPPNNKSEYICAYCRKVTTTVEEYRDHIQSHSPSLQFTCKHCPSKFGHKFQLDKHVKECLKNKVSESPPQKKARKTSERATKLRKIAPKQIQSSGCGTVTTKSKTVVQKDAKSSMPVPDCINNVINTSVKQETNSSEKDPDTAASSILPSSNVDDESLLPSKDVPSVINDDIHQRLRPKKIKITYASESPPEDNGSLQPTRRSARLVNRKPSRFSRTSTDSESADNDKNLEVDVISISSDSASILNSTTASSPKKSIIENSQSSVDNSLVGPKKNPVLVTPKKRTISPKKMIVGKCKRLKRGANVEIKNTLCCNLCSLLFRSKGSLKRHKKMHSGKPQFVCQYCGKFFYRRDIHRRHEGNVHQNATSHPLVCYYCKKNFETSSQLKEHAFASHSGKALAPERIRRCTPIKTPTETKSKIDNKPTTSPVVKSVNSNNVDEAPNAINSKAKTSTFSCTTCTASFDNQLCLIKHLDTVHKSKNAVEMPKKKKKIITKTTNSNTVMPPASAKDDEKVATSSKPTNPDSLPQLSNLTWEKTEDSCILCFTKLSEKGILMCRPEMHKAIDWYQCSICPAVGNKDLMQEHMFKHMTKIGTVIVNIHDDNAKVNYLHKDSSNLIVTNEIVEDVDRLDSTISSVCTLIEDVPCAHCSEVIVDFNLLLRHPCIEMSNNTYSCCVQDCDFSSDALNNVQDHLKTVHVVYRIFSNSPEQGDSCLINKDNVN